MPNLNGTGPEGKGKMTGRGFGNCENSYRDLKFIGRHGKPRRNSFLLDEIESLRKAVEEIKAKLDKKD